MLKGCPPATLYLSPPRQFAASLSLAVDVLTVPARFGSP